MAVQMMAIRLSPTPTQSPSLPFSSSSASLTSNKQPSFKTLSLSTSSLSLLALFSPPSDAKAASLSKDQILSSLTQVEKTIDQVQDAGSSALDVAQQIFDVLGKTLKPAIDAGLPIAQKAGEEAIKVASPAFSEASKKAQEAIQGTGLDTQPVLKTAADAAKQTTKVIDIAKPIASSTFETITSAEPLTIVGSAGALFVAYLLFPPIWSLISYSLRGYKGDLTPAQALDLISTQNYVMVDIRSEKDKDRTGVPRLPSSAKQRMVAIPLEELPSKLRSLVRSTKKVEAEIAALKIAYLKKINKGSNIVIMDSYCDSAKTVAKTLTGLGFNNCFVVADGFSGGRGWLQSRLGTDTFNFSKVEILSPSTAFPAATKRFGTTSTKFLPGAE